MKIYFDSCAIQRPLDNATQLRIVLEIDALLGIFEQVEANTIDLVSSEVLELETERIPIATRKRYALNLLANTKELVIVDEQIEARARYFGAVNVKPFDALHLACAEASGADYFCTCDDRLLKKARTISDLAIQVVSPLELFEELAL